MGNPQNITYTNELLNDYSLAALANASELILEATILYQHGHYARAYFLSVASIEETGKAFIAFNGQSRNLLDSAIQSKLKRTMEDHSKKITSAFAAWILFDPEIRKTLMPTVDLMIALKYGREPSMYTDIQVDSSNIQIPAVVVRQTASYDCIRLAKECLSHTEKHITEKAPQPFSKLQDQFFSMNDNQLNKIMGSEDFWWYYLEKMEKGDADLAAAIIAYKDNYMSKGILFRVDGNNEVPN